MRVLLVGAYNNYDVGSFFNFGLDKEGIDHLCIDYGKYYLPGSTRLQRMYLKLFSRNISALGLNREIRRAAGKLKPDLVLVVKGVGIWPGTLKYIKENCKSILVNYATDDPFAFKSTQPELVQSISFFDLYACTKRAIMDDVRNAGCQHVEFVPFAYHPELHYPDRPQGDLELRKFSSDVVFIGGGDQNRRSHMQALARIPEIRLHIYGGFWDRYPELRRYHYGFALGKDFRLALSGAKVAPGFVRHSNRDGHSMRTFEVPACGAFLLAERTAEHQEFFEEDKEAVFFTSTEELISKTIYYVKSDSDRSRIAEFGYHRTVSGKNTYLDRLMKIMSILDSF